jgi:uncharacterized phage-associated protein
MAFIPDKRLDVEKAIQAAGVILRREGNTASRLRLLKLLYIADRRSLERFGRPIVGSKIVAMKNGPLHSQILDLLNGNCVGESRWASYFQNQGVLVQLVQQPDVGLLSRSELDLLEEVTKELSEMDDWEIVEATHRFPEWQKLYPDPSENTSRHIPISEILAAVGRDADRNEISQDFVDDDAFGRFFAETNP